MLSELEPNARVKASLMTPSCGSTNEQCSTMKSISDSSCKQSLSTTSVLMRLNGTEEERQSCIKSSRSSVSSQIELLLQRLQNGEEAMFDGIDSPINPMVRCLKFSLSGMVS